MTTMKHPPLKRHPALRPLSRDHYAGLVQAEQLLRAAATGAVERRAAVAAFLDAWDRDIAPHLTDEQRLLPPLVGPAEVRTLLAEHRALSAHTAEARRRRRLVDPGVAWVHELGESLRDHIRWEERHLFPLIQETASPSELDALERQTLELDASRGRNPCRDRRTA